MAKDVNIHIKATGGPEAKQQLEGVADSAQKMGSKFESVGQSISNATRIMNKILGLWGISALITTLISGLHSVVNFFDAIKTRSDEAAQKVLDLRTEFSELFSVMNAYSEKSQQILTKESLALFQKTGVPKEVGLPVVTAYARAFQQTGLMSDPQYQQGLEQMLRYAGRPGTGAVPQMVELMAGWEMFTPEKQGAFRRMVKEAAQTSGLTEEQLISALGKGMPAIKALGWTPQQAITETAKIAATQTAPRARATMPANIFEAIMRPQIPKEFERKIPKEIREDPAKLFAWVSRQQKAMPQKDYLKLLSGAYGSETGLGIYSWLSARPMDLERIISEAAGPVGAAREAAEEKERLKTLPAKAAETSNLAEQMDIQVEKDTQAQKEVRKLGRSYRDILLRDKKRKMQHLLAEPPGERYKEEYAAYRLWFEHLTPAEKAKIISQWHEEGKPGLIGTEGLRYPSDIEEVPFKTMWRRTTWPEIEEQTKTAAKRQIASSNQPITYNDSHNTITNFNPVVGNKADLMGVRTPKNIH